MAAPDRSRAPAAALAVLLLGTPVAGCAASAQPAESPVRSLPQGDEVVELDPADFSVDITNRYWPMAPGDTWVYQETEDVVVQRIEVTVLDETKVIANGIEARVVHDVVTENGVVLEDTYDWYAQDSDGNVWYLGEATTAYENGQASEEGSWEAGVDGAQAGILLPAEAASGLTYRQEFLAEEAEDQAIVLSADEWIEAPSGSWDDVLLTRDWTPLEPEVSELKFYAPDVGPVLVLQISGGSASEVLTDSSRIS